ncbi:MAG: hypothetical protein OEY19_11315 [Gammaproteobacteria bacterium]|nr:hypothetical protein [Gammaproteobacteria bacterium]
MKKLILLFLAILMSKSLYVKAVDSLVWGMYCGECAESCATMYKIDSKSLKIDKSGDFLFDKPFNYVFKGSEASQDEQKKYEWLLKTDLPALKLNQMIFGEPDAYDQCGIYLDYSILNERYQVLIDPDKKPKLFKPLLEKLFMVEGL